MQHNAPAAGTAIGSSPAMPAPSERFPPRFERPHRGDGGSEHRRHEDPAPPQAVAAPAPARQAMPAAQPAPMPAPQPAPRPAPQPAPMAAPAAAASAGAAPQRGGDQGGDRGGRERHNGRDGNARQQDR
jgi:outer membrane biosynthesis protein TonB